MAKTRRATNEPAQDTASQRSNHAAYDVVALAASAGGLRAINSIISTLPTDLPAAIAIVQHLDLRHRSLMADILNRHTALAVKEAEEGDRLQPGTVHIAPPNRHLLVNPDGTLSLSQTQLVHFVRPSADLLFESMAASFKDRAIAVVLTGTGSDGNMGVQAIRKMGGTVIAQDQETSEFFGMPGAAIHTGDVDFVLSLERNIFGSGQPCDGRRSSVTTEEMTPEFEALLEYIKETRNFDFSGYKRSTLTRRVSKRMQSVGIDDYTGYLDYLQVHPEEFSQLFNTALINVSAFFRDPSAWQFLTTSVIPRIVADKEADEPIRIWSTGCASGEEPYTLAMVFAEALGFEQFRDRVKIYATDVDEEALTQARQAVYGAKELQEVPASYRERYFEPANGSYVFRKDYRRAVIFGRHDLMQDPPISKIDLLACRNTLIYFNAEAQRTILSRFQFALNDGGILFLGKSEMPVRNPGSLAVLDMKSRVFIKPSRSPADQALEGMPEADQGVLYDMGSRARLREAAFDSSTVAQVVLDSNHLLAVANGRARTLFGLDHRDIGRPLQWLRASYRSPELRAAITQAETARRPITLPDLEWPTSSGELTQLDVHIVPLLDSRGGSAGLSISLVDVTRDKHLQEQLVRATREAETTSEALMSTNEELQTTNEELQSTVEELETTNEELQSTNEELETLNEELESTNEEMRTVNDELRTRNDEVKRLNDFLESVLSGLRGGVVVMDRDRRVDVWNSTAESLWGLRADEVVGKDFLGLDVGLPIAELAQPLQDCLSGAIDYQQLALAATDRRGNAIECKITCTPLGRKGDEIRGAILLMERVDSETAVGNSPRATSS